MNKPLPRHVQRQLEEAQQIEAQMAQPPRVEIGDQPSVTLEAPAEPEEAPKPEPVRKPIKDDEPTWKQRYLTLQGEFNKKVPELQREVADLKTQLQGAIEKLETAAAPKPAALITDKDVEEFGADMLDVVERKTREQLAQVVTPLQSEIERLRNELAQAKEAVGSVAKLQVEDTQAKFWNALGSAVPNYNEINESAEWLAWLAEVDPFSGKARQDLLDEAAGALDHKRVIAIFQAYLRESEAPAGGQRNSADTIERQVSPTKATSAPTPAPAPAQGRIYTGAEIQYVFDPRNRKRYSDAEYKALVDDVNLAISQGRVKP